MGNYSIDDLRELISNYEPRQAHDEWGTPLTTGLYVRWSSDPVGDCQRAVSRNHASGESEMGLSVCELDHSQTCHGIDLGTSLMDRVMEYSFLFGFPWIVEGWRPNDTTLLRGSDNEPLLIDPQYIGRINI